MIDAQVQGLQRLYRGRKRAIATRRAVDRMKERHVIELAQANETSKELCARLNARMREQQREFRAWIERIQETSKETPLKKQNRSEMRNPVENGADTPVTEKKQGEETAQIPSDNAKQTEAKKQQAVCTVRSDTKTIKMKFGKTNKLASLMDTSLTGDGYYVYL
ncbi:hypothetical protein OS493_002072 [Desmophyllum pertusum]|uniref:Uncharacterized protein n=1 Tax=Desmophyllum pertusum TaxID=174260 RepID=A0A9W9Z5H5_9CNID|nr:hypothetical protein OS493_002072 [Desmophyllum pertusum]